MGAKLVELEDVPAERAEALGAVIIRGRTVRDVHEIGGIVTVRAGDEVCLGARRQLMGLVTVALDRQEHLADKYIVIGLSRSKCCRL